MEIEKDCIDKGQRPMIREWSKLLIRVEELEKVIDIFSNQIIPILLPTDTPQNIVGKEELKTTLAPFVEDCILLQNRIGNLGLRIMDFSKRLAL